MPYLLYKGMCINDAFDSEIQPSLCCRYIREKDEQPDDSESRGRDQPTSQ